MPNIDWSNAAVIAAVLAGFFALTKEVVTFTLDQIKAALKQRGELRRLQARLGQYYFQVAVGSTRALEAWIEAKHQLQQMGLGGLPQPPAISFIAHSDKALDEQLADLSIRAPEMVSLYLQVDKLRQAAIATYQREHEAFKDAPFEFSYPGTRRLLLGLLQAAAAGLKEVSETLPEDIWDPTRSAKTAYMRAATEFQHKLQEIDASSHEEVKAETMRGMLALKDQTAGDAGHS